MCSPGGNWLVACILIQVNYSLRGYLSETDESRCAKGSLTLRNRLSIWKAPFIINTVKVVPFFSHMWMKVGDRLGWTSCKDSRQYCWRQCLQSEKKQPLFSQLFYWKVVHVQFFVDFYSKCTWLNLPGWNTLPTDIVRYPWDLKYCGRVV